MKIIAWFQCYILDSHYWVKSKANSLERKVCDVCGYEEYTYDPT